MNQPLLLASLTLCMVAIRFGGLALAGVPLPPAVERNLRYIPIGMLAALTTSGVAGRPDDVWQGAVAAACGGLVGWRTRRMWAGIAAGMAVYWLLHMHPHLPTIIG